MNHEKNPPEVPFPAMVVLRNEFLAVVFSLEQANNLFRAAEGLRAAFCVAPPRSALVTNCAQAKEFFEESEKL